MIRAYASIAENLEEAGYTKAEIQEIKEDIKHFENVRKKIQLASGDYIDLKQYEPAMRHLIDSYIGAEESRVLSAFDDLSLVELIVERGKDAIKEMPESIRANKEAMAETIENNLRRVIKEESPTNPMYYEKMSVLLDELIRLRKDETGRYEEYLQKIVELTKKTKKPDMTPDYPPSMNSSAKRALFDNLGNNEPLANELDERIRTEKRDDWRGNRIKERELEIAVKKVLREHDIDEDAEIQRLMDLIKNQREYL